MCTGTPMDYLPLALATGGTLLQQQSAENAADRQQRIINNAAEENSRLQAKKADTVTDFAENTFDPSSRDQRYEDAATQNEISLKDALLSASGGEGQIYTGTQGNVSNDYTRAKAEATANSTQDIRNRTKLLARSNANGLMYNDESLRAGLLANDVLGINAASTRNNNAAQAGLTAAQDRGSTLGGLLLGMSKNIGNSRNQSHNSSGIIWN